MLQFEFRLGKFWFKLKLHYLMFQHKLKLQTLLFRVMFDNQLLGIVKFQFMIISPLIYDDQSTYDYLKDDDYSFILQFH